ncbi:hypothetical protein EZS27_024377 [termite gut metagenome]|uniref:GP-PDE domain-containing protein n=1 Tax=termite gut metagenome TaxID=433724 RepID=A0A5J4QX51_9ZZZZ
MTKKIFQILLLIALFQVLFLIIYLLSRPTPKNFQFECENNLPILIAHAGGIMDGKTYTNSIEAVDLAIKNNYRFIELDLLILEDKKIVAAHDILHFNSITGFENNTSSLTSENVKSRKIYDSLHPILSDDINKIFQNTNLYLVTDKIEDHDLLINEIDIGKENLLVEVFSYKSYVQSLQKGIRYPMLCIWSRQQLIFYLPLLLTNKIKNITIPAGMINSCQQQLEYFYKKGVNIFAFTSNNKEFILKHGRKTVSGFYTDSITYQNLLQ